MHQSNFCPLDDTYRPGGGLDPPPSPLVYPLFYSILIHSQGVLLSSFTIEAFLISFQEHPAFFSSLVLVTQRPIFGTDAFFLCLPYSFVISSVLPMFVFEQLSFPRSPLDGTLSSAPFPLFPGLPSYADCFKFFRPLAPNGEELPDLRGCPVFSFPGPPSPFLFESQG